MVDDRATLVSLDIEHRTADSVDAIFSIRLAEQSVTCAVTVPYNGDLSLHELEALARVQLADRLRALADDLQSKGA